MINSGTWFIQATVRSTGRPDYPEMSSKINILVVGDADEATTLFGKHEATRIRFSRYAGDNDMATPLRQTGRQYDWILVNAASFDGDEKDLIQSLRVTGSFISEGHRWGSQPCGVEWLPDGSLHW